VNFIDCFIDLIEANHWYFGGGMFDGAILGTVYAYRDLTVSEVQETLKAWFRRHGYSLDASFGYILETPDLELRQAEFADWKPMYKNIWQHESAARYMTWDVTRSEDEARDRIERTIRYQQNGGLSFIVAKDGEPIGFAGVTETAPGIFEDTGGCLGPDFQRKGYGKQMLGLALRFAFDILKVQKVTLGVLENNPGAYHCYKAAGFKDVPMDEPEYYHLMGEKIKCLELETEGYL
jgi:RimJ/RimL family protein N-acetyltransferase